MTPAVAVSGFLAAAVALALSGGDTAVSAHDLRILAFLGCVMVPLALTMFISGTRTVPAAEVALLALMETVFGPLWAWLGVGEVPTTESFLGGSLVIAAVALNSTLALLGRRGRRRAA
jgi:drug/metabolite transporter (DMT)-like permease